MLQSGKRPKLAQVAKTAGVSLSTASLALSGSRRVSPQTRDRVFHAAKLLGYRVDPIARALRVGSGRLVGVYFDPVLKSLQSRTTQVFFTRLLEGIIDNLAANGVAVVLFGSVGYDHVPSLPIDAMFVLSQTPGPLPDIVPEGVPVIVSATTPASDQVRGLVYHNHPAMTRQVCDHLRANGARRTAMLPRPGDFTYVDASVRAYLQWCDDVGQSPVVIGTELAPSDVTESVRAAVADGVDGVYSMIGEVVGVLNGVAAAGRVVGEEVLVACLSEGVIEEFLTPPVTCMSMMASQCALIVSELLANIDQDSPVRTIELPFELIVRESSGAAQGSVT